MKQNRKPRVALGVFYNLDTLQESLGEVEINEHIGNKAFLLAAPGALNGSLEKIYSTESDGISSSGPNLIILGTTDNISKPSEKRDHQNDFTPHLIAGFANWILPEMANNLQQHLAQGACVLLIPVSTATREHSVSKILLHHSADQIQIHDLPTSV